MRKAQAKKLPLAPDPKFNDKLVTRFVNNLMWEGKKAELIIFFMMLLKEYPKFQGKMDMKYGREHCPMLLLL